ncbi:hypothetical protein J6590_080801 [Homalodisca vitripennis]|nr:hypothetical protein J6590_080801 [Homalodisca vitripennis]
MCGAVRGMGELRVGAGRGRKCLTPRRPKKSVAVLAPPNNLRPGHMPRVPPPSYVAHCRSGLLMKICKVLVESHSKTSFPQRVSSDISNIGIHLKRITTCAVLTVSRVNQFHPKRNQACGASH